MKTIRLMALALAVSGCGTVGVSAMRTNFDGDDDVLTHCETLQEPRPNELAQKSAFDESVRAASLEGWKLSYVAQYVRGIKSKITVRYCLEKKLDDTNRTSGGAPKPHGVHVTDTPPPVADSR